MSLLVAQVLLNIAPYALVIALVLGVALVVGYVLARRAEKRGDRGRSHPGNWPLWMRVIGVPFAWSAFLGLLVSIAAIYTGVWA